MMRIRVLLIIVIAVVVMSAGCVGQTPTTPMGVDGIVVKNLYIDPSPDQIVSGEWVTVTADIENVGGSTARNVRAELIGAAWLEPPVPVPYQPWLIDEDGDGVLGITLSPPDPQYGTPGQLRTITFRIPSPSLPEGQKATFNLKIRVTYDYQTSSVTQLKAYSRERYNSLYQMGKITSPRTTTLPTEVTKNVPITVSITGSDKMISGPYLYDEYSYQITFSNVGSQIPTTYNYFKGMQEDGLISGRIWVQGPGVFFRDCMGISPQTLLGGGGLPSNTNIFLEGMIQYGDKFNAWYSQTPWNTAYGAAVKIGSLAIGIQGVTPPDIIWPAYALYPNAISWDYFRGMEQIKLRRGQSVTKSCTIGILNDPTQPASWANRPEDNILIYTQLHYTYFIEQNVDLTVTAPVIHVPPILPTA